MTTDEFKQMLTDEYGDDLICFTDLSQEAIVTVKQGRFYMGGTMSEALECGYPVDGLMLVSRTCEEAMSAHMKAVSDYQARSGDACGS